MIPLAIAAYPLIQGAQPPVQEAPAVTRWVQTGPDSYLVEVTPCGPLPQCVIRISPEGRPPLNEAPK